MTLGYLDPIAFYLFSKPIYWYGIIIAMTVLVAYMMADHEATKRGLKKETMLDLLRGIKIIKMLDIIAPSLLVGQMLGRWGNFFNHEAYGEVVSREFLEKRFIPDFIIENMYIDGAYRQPTFLYESLWCFIALVILLLIRNKLAQSEVFAMYIVLYGVERFIVEGMRTDSLYIGSLRVSQVLSLVFVIGSLIYLIMLNTKYKDKKVLYIES